MSSFSSPHRDMKTQDAEPQTAHDGQTSILHGNSLPTASECAERECTL